MSSWFSPLGGTGADPLWWSGLASTRTRSGRPPPDAASGAQTSLLGQLSGSDPAEPWSLLGNSPDGPPDLNQNGQWEASEIELWQAQQDSGRLAWLLIMLARAEVDRLRSEGGPVVTARKSLSQARQSFEQGDYSRAMALAGRAQAQARRGLERQKVRKDLEADARGDPAPPDDPHDSDRKNIESGDRAGDGNYVERLWGLANQSRQLTQRLAGRPPPEYVEVDV